MAYRWALAAVLFCGAVVLAIALTLQDTPPGDLTWFGAPAPEAVWLPGLTGVALAWVLTDRGYLRALDDRTWGALRGHPIGVELTWLLFFLACFVGGSALLAYVFGQLGPDVPYTPVVRIVFLFVLPILFVDRAGYTLSGYGTAMPSHVLRVSEGRRWLGLVPVLACFAVAALAVYPTSPPTPKLVLFAAAIGFFAVAVPEEIFFRSMVQTRLERLLGRWGGLLLTALIFALTYALLGAHIESDPLPGDGFLTGVVDALLIYGALGVLYGYVWTCYRNLWLNILLHGGVTLLIAAPSLLIL
ncbi:membrane protease YdiL (CAAX protease family) [Nocardiopsis mwathae]|uniref:Membrane protease YdiL (CAAX protease family) n=1 Tax=Nocardiopsis mwathae TaxID=1472723 RepID=A0A7W9YK51_9ACTN|nr:CPBP family intramembrane glutamic endopeptidase [Nocardiopsis mwathae]MBB6173650.1 membrane protease YdiL (CAAX protease family) [Nocardiopsis mwathae]